MKINSKNIKEYKTSPKQRLYAKKYYLKIKKTEKYKARKRAYNLISYHNRKHIRLETEAVKRQEKRRQLMKDLGGIFCKKCGFNDFRALQFDHINGKGTEQRRKSNNTWTILKDIEENPGNYQVLCANCNWIKRIENKECAKTRLNHAEATQRYLHKLEEYRNELS